MLSGTSQLHLLCACSLFVPGRGGSAVVCDEARRTCSPERLFTCGLRKCRREGASAPRAARTECSPRRL